mgnify:CR=1 FL=1
MAFATRRAAGVVTDIVNGHRQGAVMPLKHHPEGVADKDYVNARFTDHLGKGGVIGGKGSEGFAPLLELTQGIDGNSHRILAFWVDGPGRAGVSALKC